MAGAGVSGRTRGQAQSTTSLPAPTTSSSATPGSRGSGRKPPYEYEIHTIGVDPAYQGQGIGRRLLSELLEYAAGGAVFLEVRTDNEAAIALYESVGFVNVGLRRRYYRASGADAYTMRRDPP